jgi:hypothetical protein
MPNKGLKFVDIQEHSDARGTMRIVEVDSGLPFVPVRSFIISDVPSDKSRAGHAVSCDELIIVAQGSCLITARTGAGLEEHRLTPDTGAAHLRPGTWLMLSEFEPGTILVTYASERYAETRFFEDYVVLDR